MNETVRPERVLKGLRPLLWHRGDLYLSTYNRVFRTSDLGRTMEEIARFEVRHSCEWMIARSALAQRVLRMSVYRLRVTDSGALVFIFRGGLFRVAAGKKSAAITHPITEGSRPVSLAYRPGGLVVWGEYVANRARRAIHVYGSDDDGVTYRPVYTFPAGTIRHIHGISYDPYDDCFWICCGDYQDEARLVKASADFKTVEVKLVGGQANRFYSIAVLKDQVVMANDCPNADNYIVSFHKETGRTKILARIDNSSFYHCLVGETYFCSTNAERPEKGGEYTADPRNDFRRVYIWRADLRTAQSDRFMSFGTDFWAMCHGLPKVSTGLFQYSNVYFPEGDNPSAKLVCAPKGVSKYDNSTVIYAL